MKRISATEANRGLFQAPGQRQEGQAGRDHRPRRSRGAARARVAAGRRAAAQDAARTGRSSCERLRSQPVLEHSRVARATNSTTTTIDGAVRARQQCPDLRRGHCNDTRRRNIAIDVDRCASGRIALCFRCRPPAKPLRWLIRKGGLTRQPGRRADQLVAGSHDGLPIDSRGLPTALRSRRASCTPALGCRHPRGQRRSRSAVSSDRRHAAWLRMERRDDRQSIRSQPAESRQPSLRQPNFTRE